MGNCLKSSSPAGGNELARPNNIQRVSDLNGAATYARHVAGLDHTDPAYVDLSSRMCWNAVTRCAEVAGGMLQDSMVVSSNSYDHFIPKLDARRITTAAEMANVPEGSFIGFFDDDTGFIIHAMMATGNGQAAGNKNSCIGIGAHVGWEILNLADNERWNNNGMWCAIFARGHVREISVYYRLDW
mmetsp:Transcript_4336/g.6620  ORF Transcript_4336/g.6620 Transcript_4336/m.6620 type:complete len:185 (-) Transcript_4336:191-745(-)